MIMRLRSALEKFVRLMRKARGSGRRTAMRARAASIRMRKK